MAGTRRGKPQYHIKRRSSRPSDQGSPTALRIKGRVSRTSLTRRPREKNHRATPQKGAISMRSTTAATNTNGVRAMIVYATGLEYVEGLSSTQLAKLVAVRASFFATRSLWWGLRE